MTPDAFRRLALLACCSGYALAVVLVGVLVGVWAVPVVVVGGLLLAVFVSVEAAPEETGQKINGDVNPDRPRGFLRLPGPGSGR